MPLKKKKKKKFILTLAKQNKISLKKFFYMMAKQIFLLPIYVLFRVLL
jgi:hypothetical protein